jgi:hypothetical protein
MDEITLHVRNDVPYILDIDLAVALGMRRPVDIRMGLMKVYWSGPMHYGPLHRLEDAAPRMTVDPSQAYLLTEEQAVFICHFSTSRKAPAARQLIINAFMRHKGLATMLREALARTGGSFAEGREAVLIDALKARLRQTVKVRQHVTRRQRLPNVGRSRLHMQ